MNIVKRLRIIYLHFCKFLCAVFYDSNKCRIFKKCINFLWGFFLGMLYYYYLLKKIPFPHNSGLILSLVLSVILGLGNTISVQIRCISLLIFPMYCGKAGRGVLKAVLLTYVIAGPITNMGFNAKEVVRVFACSTQLSYNLSKTKYTLMADPIRNAMLGLNSEIDQVKDTFRSFSDIAGPIANEIKGENEIQKSRRDIDYIDGLFEKRHRASNIEKKYRMKRQDKPYNIYQKTYLKKLEFRCENLLSRSAVECTEALAGAYERCIDAVPGNAGWMTCWPLKLTYLCDIKRVLGPNVCDSRTQIDPGLGEAYVYLEKAKDELINFKGIKLQYKITNVRELFNIQDAKETGERVMHAFEQKNIIMHQVFAAVNIFVALLFLRIVIAAATYHDLYLMSIVFDNIYITGYFKRIDRRRRRKDKYTILPLKKMERSKYVDIHSITYLSSQHNKLLTQILKVMLEMITATTFVMLDRLFYEALDVVRQYAEMETTQQGTHDLYIEVKGTGMLASLLRKILNGLNNSNHHVRREITNKPCLPHPRLMPPIYFVKIYGGYLWILLLLYLNPYTLRLRRLICSYFYPRREKHRILHLYNDILKKRLKMQKTLGRVAVQAARAHYLSGENLLSMRIKFPQILGWLKILPAARMTCLICGETEPRTNGKNPRDLWHSCSKPRCPFVYCAECWREIGRRCLACDPSLSELSDVDSLTEDEQPTY